MSKYIQKARTFARETSHQFHSARDDVTRKQIYKERSKLPRHSSNSEFSSVSSSSFKYSDIDITHEDEEQDISSFDDNSVHSSTDSHIVLHSTLSDNGSTEDIHYDAITDNDSLSHDLPLFDELESNNGINTTVSIINEVTTHPPIEETNTNLEFAEGGINLAETDELYYSLTSYPPLSSELEENTFELNTSNHENETGNDLFHSIKPDAITEEYSSSTSITKTAVSNPMLSEVVNHPLLLQDDDYINSNCHSDLSMTLQAENNNRIIIPRNNGLLQSLSNSSSLENVTLLSSQYNVIEEPIAAQSSVNYSATFSTAVSNREVSMEQPASYLKSTDLSVVINNKSEPPVPAIVNQSEDEYTLLLSLLFATLTLYLYYSLNPFVYLAGFLAGFLLFYITIGSAFVLYVQYSEREKEKRKENDRKVNLPQIDKLPATVEVNFENNRILKSNKFGMVHQYHPSAHHPSQRVAAKVKLYDDFFLEVCYKKTTSTPQGGSVTKREVLKKDLRCCSILLVPEEVAQNRKRRWSKKFPLSIAWVSKTKGRIFLFPFTSRDKEDWFRRLRAASEGQTYDQLVSANKIYYRYMGMYMPTEENRTKPVVGQLSIPVSASSSRHHLKKEQRSSLQATSVHFSTTDKFTAKESEDISVSIEKHNKIETVRNTTSTTSNEKAVGISNIPMSLSFSLGWINAGMARLAWDLWHEDRWKKWVTSRIQRKLVRVKTPSFMETLKVTEVNMGMNMPVIKYPFDLPKVDNRGLWIYLNVEYEGSFTMTIETKLKLEPKGIKEVLHYNTANTSPPLAHSSSSLSPTLQMEEGYKPNTHHHSNRKTNEDEEISSGSDEESTDSSSLTQSLEEKLLESANSMTTNEQGNNDDGPLGRKEKLLTNMVSKLQKIATKSRLVAKAAEKVSSYPLILTVEVKQLDGLLVLNMAPPPSDTIWYGFAKTPYLDLVAKPKLGQREVTLSYVTDWIEKKLCEIVEKKLVLPNMEDLVVPVLNSGLPEDKIQEMLEAP